MWQLYIRGSQRMANGGTPAEAYRSICPVCANRLIQRWILLQNAESANPSELLFLIRSAASGLTVILPNMDWMAGGEPK